MNITEYQWISRSLYEYRWNALNINEHQGKCMHINEYQWILIHITYQGLSLDNRYHRISMNKVSMNIKKYQ